jgi:hypothetical protein
VKEYKKSKKRVQKEYKKKRKGTKRAKRMQLSHPGLPAGTLAAILSGAIRRLDCGGIELTIYD